jgi:hypothetical protein
MTTTITDPGIRETPMSQCAITASDFRPPGWLRNPHLQTLWTGALILHCNSALSNTGQIDTLTHSTVIGFAVSFEQC